MKMLQTLALLTLLSTAYADVYISGPRTLSLKPGTSDTAEYTLTNSGDTAIRATVFTNDYLQAPDGSLVHAPALSVPQSLARFLKFSQTAFVVPGKGTVSVRANISVPANASGGYWGVIGVEGETPVVKANTANAVGIRVRYAMVTALEVVGSVKHALSIENLAQGPAGAPSLQVTLRNAGNAYERVSLRVAYQDAATGQTVEDTRPYVVLPGTVDLIVPVPVTVAAGPKAVFVVAEYADDARAEAVGTLTVDRK